MKKGTDMNRDQTKEETAIKIKRKSFIQKLRAKLVAKFKKKDPNIYPAY